jgi:hypothetical protein
MSYTLARDFTEFKIPDEVMQAQSMGMKFIGSLGFTKMIMFAKDNNLNNDQIDYFMAMPPRRLEDENKDDFKVRGRFQKQLYKYRAYLYDYSVFNKVIA